MKTFIKLIGHATVMMILWLMTTVTVNGVLHVTMPETGEDPLTALGLMWIASFFYSLAIHLYVVNTHLNKLNLFLSVALVLFVIQYFLSQIETFYFIDQAVLTSEIVWSIMLAGFFQSIAYALYVIWVYPTFSKSHKRSISINRQSISRIIVLILLIYPAIYFLAGYYIAWQSPVLRTYYQGSENLESFWTMLSLNVQSGLYLFQIMRAIIWVSMGIMVTYLLQSSFSRSAVILGLLFATLMGIGLIIPNPFMPTEVKYFHLIELLVSNFVWGICLVYFLIPLFTNAESDMIIKNEPENSLIS